MHVLSGGRIRTSRRTYYRDAGPDETLDLPVSCFLLRHKQGNVLFDTGCHPDVIERPGERWGALTAYLSPVMPAEENVLTGLRAVGLGPDDIDVVVCSHLHTDHCGCNAFFTRSTVLVHAREVEAARAANAAQRGYIAADWDHPIPMQQFDRQADLFGDGRIVLLPLPGHTTGTTGALVRLDHAGKFLLASDALNARANLADDFTPLNTLDPDQARQSYAEIRKIEAGGGTVLCGHDLDQWNALRKGPHAYE